MATKSVERLLTSDEVAEILGVDRRTVPQWRYRGYGPDWVKIGTHVRYRPQDVEAYIAAHVRKPSRP
ncbi:helix-turn-helix domain-containing protein [Streptomyces macrosporus]|uniref:Helix-turn-helix domain-containing protein n=1 Tax=Streptomyces macrosporus TaxID=44032 RepID=A0ABN3K6T1_9ACTN